MNEQEMIQRQKIEKREKTDIILAYILIVILLAGIGIVLYLKYGSSQDNTKVPNEHVSNYITLDKISNSLNSSNLSSKLIADGATFTSTVNENNLIVNYSKEDTKVDLTIPLIDNELEINIKEENKDLITQIYKEIMNIICTYYGNDANSCTAAIKEVNSTEDGIRFVNDENNNIVYINIMKSIDVSKYSNTNSANTLSLADISKENTSNILVNNVSITSGTDVINVNYQVEFKDQNLANNFSVNIALYDDNDTLLEEQNKEYTKEDITSPKIDTISFNLDDTLKLDNIKKYSINITQ